MNLQLDENLSHHLVPVIAEMGHDVDTVADEGLVVSSDLDVLEAARTEGRTILTQDRGFGDIRAYPPGSHQGIIVLRPTSQDPISVHDLVSRLLRTIDLDDVL
ncbi:DUF5615 family PIN-like protein [Euzebya tangerina]|uniref:DUF5615 family PIN-like protein n=1 Tax=Euzebya tangerina TaxID=591198 RepID=UPI0013C2D4F9